MVLVVVATSADGVTVVVVDGVTSGGDELFAAIDSKMES